MVRKLFPEGAKGGDDSILGIGGKKKAVLISDADGGQAEASRSDTGDDAGIGRDADITTILDQACIRISLFPEITHGETFQFVQKLQVVVGKRRGSGRRRGS